MMIKKYYFPLYTHIKFLTVIFLLSILQSPLYSFDINERKWECRGEKNYRKCIEESRKKSHHIGISSQKPVEIKVIPYRN